MRRFGPGPRRGQDVGIVGARHSSRRDMVPEEAVDLSARTLRQRAGCPWGASQRTIHIPRCRRSKAVHGQIGRAKKPPWDSPLIHTFAHAQDSARKGGGPLNDRKRHSRHPRRIALKQGSMDIGRRGRLAHHLLPWHSPPAVVFFFDAPFETSLLPPPWKQGAGSQVGCPAHSWPWDEAKRQKGNKCEEG